MQVKEIVDRVRSAIDERMANDSEFLGLTSDEQNLTAAIIDNIPYALTYIIENAPEEKLSFDMISSPTQQEMSGVVIAAGDCVKMRIPADVLRIVTARLSSWSLSPLPVTEFSQQYLMQQDAYARGSWDRPVNAIVYHGTERYLEMYSAKTDNDVIEVGFIRKPADLPSGLNGESTYNVAVPYRLEAAFIYQIAGLTMTAFREQVATSLFAIAREYMKENDLE